MADLPEALRSVDRAAAAAKAVAVRRERAAIKQAVARRTIAPAQVLADSLVAESAAAGLRVTDLLGAIPGVGPIRVQAALADLAISERKRLGGLGEQQRRRLAEYLAAFTPTVAARGRLIVLAGPTAVGKGTVTQHIREHYPEVLLSVSATTRAPRPGEVEGVNYYFVTNEQFDDMVASGQMLEWAVVHNQNRYGTPRGPVEAALAAGRSVLLEIDLQGARQVRAAMPEAVLVFLAPPSWEELVRRLIGRGTESAEEQQRRLDTAKVELAAQDEFDVRIVNDEVAVAAQKVVDLLGASAQQASGIEE